jgi:HK97 family phage portal protein
MLRRFIESRAGRYVRGLRAYGVGGVGLPPPETRSGTPWYSVFLPAGGGGAYSVTPGMAENLSTVTACVNAVASGLASLPVYLYQTIPGAGRMEAPTNPAARLLRRPNTRQTWPDFLEWTLGSVLLHGNALAIIETDGTGAPGALVPVPWGAVQPVALPSGRLAFDVVAHRTPWGSAGMPRRLLDSECFYLKDRSDDGWTGRSRISRANEVLGAAYGLQQYSGAIWQNAATPSGMVTLPSNVTREEKDRIEHYYRAKVTGTDNAKGVLFVDKDTTFTAMSVSPEDAEVLASRRFTVEELCRLFQVPPPLVQDYTHNTFTNSAQASLWFAQFSLAPWARKIEAEFARSVLLDDPTHHLEIDLSGLTRGDYATRWDASVKAVAAGILDAEEVREAEGYGPRRVTGGP